MERFRVTPANNTSQYAPQQQQSLDYDPPLNGTQLEHQHLVPKSTSECEKIKVLSRLTTLFIVSFTIFNVTFAFVSKFSFFFFFFKTFFESNREKEAHLFYREKDGKD
ncbi:solute carrier family 12 member 7 isoform X1 [Apis mellifera caucasica]|nr:solute carrier family 12 member 7 isoform X1 [Apis mellifera caucasica]